MEKVKSFIANNVWTFAKSMPKTPHEWVCKDNLNEEDKKTFEYVVKFIRENGERYAFFRTSFIYLHLDGYYYWTMGAPIEETTIINRASEKNCRVVTSRKPDGSIIKYMFIKE